MQSLQPEITDEQSASYERKPADALQGLADWLDFQASISVTEEDAARMRRWREAVEAAAPGAAAPAGMPSDALRAFAQMIALQKPARTDYLGGTCSQCRQNIDAADDALAASPVQADQQPSPDVSMDCKAGVCRYPTTCKEAGECRHDDDAPQPDLEGWPDPDRYVDCGEVRPLPMYHLHTLLRHREEYAARPIARVCCGEYATCTRACTPRGRWQATNDTGGTEA